VTRPWCSLFALLLSSSLALGETADSAPTLTFPQFANARQIRFVVYGDMRFAPPSITSGTNPRIRRWIAEQVAQERPQVLLLTGDTPFTGASDADWEDFQNETESWREQGILTLPATGNHEAYGGLEKGIANYLKNFPVIDGNRYYSALLGNVEVIALDCTEGSGLATPQAQWFAAQLDRLPAQVAFLFVLYHIPWVADRQSQVFVNLPSKDALLLRGILETHLPRLHARVLVLNGHIHNYERFERNRVEYVVTGGGGAEPYPLLYRGHSDLYRDRGFPVYHFLVLDVNARELSAVMWKITDPEAQNLELEQKDSFTIPAPARIRPPGPRTKTGVTGPR
jgi:calcineurin-like phosphoesterase family protein